MAEWQRCAFCHAPINEDFSGPHREGCPLAQIEIDDSERTPCEVWSRVMGYHRPVSWWNKGKQQEFRDRKHFREPQHAAEFSLQAPGDGQCS